MANGETIHICIRDPDLHPRRPAAAQARHRDPDANASGNTNTSGNAYANTDANGDVERVPISDLVLSDSPRSTGEDAEHARALAELESGAELPPIIVQRGTNRVIDGVHRVRAAQLRGEESIRASYFDGDDESAFVLAVRLNVQHGLPLSLADRKSAARRILAERASWSNRAIAAVAGLSPKTVAALRTAAGEPGGQARLGRDGRVRPMSTAAGRERAKEILLKDPTSSLRAVSAVAGVSPGTVRAVRDELREQLCDQLREQAGTAVPDPRATAPARRPDPDVPRLGEAAARRGGRDGLAPLEAMLRSLRTDPSLRFTQSGRLLLSVLAVAPMDARTRERLIADLPEHCVDFVAELAAASVQAWQEFAARLEQRRSASA